MPLSFRPNSKVWIWLDSDKEIELDKRPKFLARVLTCEQVDAWHESLQALVRVNGTYGDVANLLLTHISDWANFPEPFSADALKRVLTRKELWELTLNLPDKIGLAEDQLPLSGSPSPTAGAASADLAPAVNATTNPANANPS